MSLYNNVPTMSWVHATGISVIWCGELYTVQDFSTNKKYVYWNATIPNQLNASNVMPDRSIQQFLVLVNDNGIATEVPSTTDDFSIAYDGNNTQAIRDRIFGLYEKNEEFGNKFVAIEQNIDGIKQIVGSSENDKGTLVNKVSVIEQRVGSIDLSVQEISKNYNDDKETNQIRENLNGSIIKLNSNLGTFKSELTSYFKNNEISDDEMIKISTQLEIIEVSKVDVDNNVDLVILIAQKNNQGQDVVALESAKKALDNAHTNLKNNITNAALDRIITPTEITVVIDAFAKCSLRINELKNTCDDVIILGLGGVITEELANISLKSDEIKLAVSQIESTFKSDTSVAKIESEKQIEDNTMALDILKKSVEDSYKDGTISDTEKKVIEEKIPLLLKEKGDIDTLVDTYSKSEYISDSIKTKLISIHEVYTSKHNTLIEKIRIIILDGFVNDAEKVQLDTVFKECLNSINTMSIALKESIDNVGFNKANIELQKAKEEINKQITDVKDSIKNMDDFINGTFENNVLDEMERKDIQQNLETLNREKLDIDTTYNELYGSAFLIGQDKIDLKTAYDKYIVRFNEVINVMTDILNKQELITDVDRANLNSAITKLKEVLPLIFTQFNKAIDTIATNKVNDVKETIDNELNSLKNQVGSLDEYIDNTFKDNVIDESERKTISQNLEVLNREKVDIDKTYEQLYANVNLDGAAKEELRLCFENFVQKHNEAIAVIQGILDKTELINDADRNSMSVAFENLKVALSEFVTSSNKAIEYISTKKVEISKGELQTEIKDVNDKLDTLVGDINGAISDGIIDEAESIIISDNLNRLAKEKLDIDAKYTTIYENVDLEGDAKSNLLNAKNNYNTKFNSVVSTIVSIIEDKKVSDAEKQLFDTAIEEYNNSSANLSLCFEMAIDFIANKKVEDASGLLSQEISDLNGALGDLESTMNNTFKDGVLSDAEKLAIKQNLKTLETSKLNIDKQYNAVYNNTSLIGDGKTSLKTSYDNYVSKYNTLVSVINEILNKNGILVESDKVKLNNAFTEHNSCVGIYSQKVTEAIDFIANKNIDDTKNELQGNIKDVADSVGTLENTMNGVFQDGILTEAEKLAIKQNLLNLSSEKSDIDKQYTTIYSNPDLINPYKSNFKIAYDEYVASYNSLVSVINTILNKTGLVDDTDRNNLNSAFRTHDTKLGLYTIKATESVDAIAKKKAEDESEKVDKKYAEILLTPDGIVSKVERTHEQINGSNGIEKRLSTAEEKITPEGITQTVQNSQFIKDLNGKVTTNTSNISKIDQKADSINLEVQKKVNNNSIISSINMSPESIKINASKVNITGFVTFSNLTDGVTTISGSNIKTGIIDSNKVNIKGGTTKKIVIANDNYCVYDGAETDVNRKVFIGFRKHSQTISVPSIILGYNGVNPDTDGSVTPGGTYTTYSHYKNYDNPEGVNLSYSALAFKYNAQPNDICTFNMYQDGKIGVQAGTSIHLRANKSSMGNAQFVIENDKVYSRKNLSTYGTFYSQGTISTGGSVFATGDSSFDRKVTAGSFNTAGTIYASGNITSNSNIYVGNTLKVPNMYTNRFYFESSSHLAFGKNSYNNNMLNGTHWDWQGHNLVNVYIYPLKIAIPHIEDDLKVLDLNNFDTLGQIKFREITKYNGERQEIIDTTNVTNLSEITSGNDVDLIKIVNLLIKEVQYLKEKNRLGGI